ncbi:MAG TPA: hypothetical protein VF333_09975 [Pyrinomonadaceae bacterium]
MKREAATREKRALAGSQGGSKTQANREQMPDTDNDIDCLRVIEEFCVSLGLPKKDGESCFHKWHANGWTNGGRPIRDWKATIRSWKSSGYMPSQKVGLNGQKAYIPPKKIKPQPDGWEDWRTEHYPEAKEHDFWRVTDEVKKEFRTAPNHLTA